MYPFPHLYKRLDARHSICYVWFEAMHTRVDMALCHLPEAQACGLAAAMRDEIFRIARFADRFNPESELSRLNREASRQEIKPSAELHAIISHCMDCHRRTAGAFDITVQSTSHDPHTIDQVVCNPHTGTIRFTRPGVTIDLCGYIKGYALDQVHRLLKQSPCSDALISLGNSSVLACGNHPGGQGWPIVLPGQAGRSVTLSGQCLTTSGNTEGHYHLIDPRTGRTLSSIVPTSVITPDGSTGEVLSTALAVADEAQRQFIARSFQGQFSLA